jgi:predicted amidophosphoribosyltransferase
MVVDEIKNRFLYFIKTEKMDAILYVPPTIKRKLQIMTYLEKNLQIDLPNAVVKKINNPIVIPQKALSKIFERVANAKKTFVVPEQQSYQHILIIDDAIGSGATINEIALKIKQYSKKDIRASYYW